MDLVMHPRMKDTFTLLTLGMGWGDVKDFFTGLWILTQLSLSILITIPAQAILQANAEDYKIKISSDYMHSVNSCPPMNIISVVTTGVPKPHEEMIAIIQAECKKLANYDTIYVCSLLPRMEVEPQTEYTLSKDSVRILYMFYATYPKRDYEGKGNLNLNPHIIYDPEAKLFERYVNLNAFKD